MANERRLIDARKLQKLVKEFRDEAPCATARKHVCNVILSMLGDKNQTPTVDAVEVIRCKDCKHMEITPDNLRWCNAWNGINGMGDNGYCNYGKRKSGTQPQREDV